MGPHSQCRALLVWIQHVTLREQKQKLKIITNLKQNGHALLIPHTRIGMLFPYAYICKLLDQNCSIPLLMNGSSNNAKTLTIKHYVNKTNLSSLITSIYWIKQLQAKKYVYLLTYFKFTYDNNTVWLTGLNYDKNYFKKSTSKAGF
jgi:hypothetical protein